MAARPARRAGKLGLRGRVIIGTTSPLVRSDLSGLHQPHDFAVLIARLDRNVHLDRNCGRPVQRSTLAPDVDQMPRLAIVDAVQHERHIDAL